MTSSPLEPEDYDCVAIVTNHSAIDYADVVAARQRDRRLPQRHQGPRGRRQGLEACDRHRSGRRPRLLGPEPRPELRRARRARRGSATSTTSCASSSPRAIPNARVTASFDELLADDELDAVVVATPVPTHYALAKQALEAGKHVFVEKPPAMRAAEMDELVALAAAARPRADARPPAALPPRRAEAEGARRRGRARRRAVRLRQPPEPRHRAHERERALVARRARPLGDPLPARRGSRGRGRARPRLPDAGRRGRRLLLPPLPVAARSRTCTCRGSTRTRCGR